MMSCEHHDYIEIACMFRYPLLLRLKSGETVQGTALDTRRDQQRQECLVLTRPEQWIPVDNIASLEVLVENPHFKRVDLS